MRRLILFTTLLLVALTVSQAKAPAVTYFDSGTVSAAFAKGAVLFDGQGGNYMVHASRRAAAGMAEIHTKDADIVYVLEGTATLVRTKALITSISFHLHIWFFRWRLLFNRQSERGLLCRLCITPMVMIQ